MDRLERLHQAGQSVWLDYIRRDLIQSGELARLVAVGEVRGVTSNPTIFEQAISGSDLYSSPIRQLAHAGWTERQIFDALAIEDVRAAADVFIPLYESSNGTDGFVSIEVNPELAYDTEETLREARRLWSAVNRPNLMIKIPGTEPGLPAIERAILEGINVNVTLIFSLERYAEVVEAYLSGLEGRLAEGNLLNHVASVASFFVSRVDTNVDSKLEAVLRAGGPKAKRAVVLLGQAAIANAKLVYAQFEAAFSGERFQYLRQLGAQVQRPLWASTSTKNPAYPDTYYVDNLIGLDTVNTLPPHTLEAFRDHGEVSSSLQANFSAARSHLEALGPLGISMDEVTAELEREGVQKFADSYASVLRTIRDRAEAFRSELGPLLPAVGRKLEELRRDEGIRQIWEASVDSKRAKPRQDAPGGTWLQKLYLRRGMVLEVAEMEARAVQARERGIKDVVLLSPRGLSQLVNLLAAIPGRSGGMRMHVLETPNPDAIWRISRKTSIPETLFLAVEPDGPAAEVRDMVAHFLDRSSRRSGPQAREHFLLVAREGSPLAHLGEEHLLQRLIVREDGEAGVHSPLGLAGVVLAAFLGINASDLNQGAAGMIRRCGPGTEIAQNPGAYLGAVLTAALDEGRDRLSLVADPGLEPLAKWVELLLAPRSRFLGRAGMSVITEPSEPPEPESGNWLIVYLRLDGSHDHRIASRGIAGVPVLVLECGLDVEGLGAETIRWGMGAELLGRAAGERLAVLDRPPRWDDHAGELVRELQHGGILKRLPLLREEDHISLWGHEPGGAASEQGTLVVTLAAVLGQVAAGDVLIWRSHMDETPSVRKTLRTLREGLWDRLGILSVLDEGQNPSCPGGPSRGMDEGGLVWVVVFAEARKDLAVPGSATSFGLLHKGRALGELRELMAMGYAAYGVGLDSPLLLGNFASDLLGAIKARRVG